MNTAQDLATPEGPYDGAIDIACRSIAPNWPLDRQIAVNPHWGWVDRPFDTMAARLSHLVGARFALPPEEYLKAWECGDITESALSRSLAAHSLRSTTDSAVEALRGTTLPGDGLPLLSDSIDQQTSRRAGPRWRDTITQQVSQYCASYFDEHQADWHRGQAAGLFEGWRLGLQSDQSLEPLMHAPEIRQRARQLPTRADAAIQWSLERLGIEPDQAPDFLQACLLHINGWASWCAYLNWEAGLAGGIDTRLRELLAIRTSWEALLHDGSQATESRGRIWHDHWTRAQGRDASPREDWLLIWQRAQEISHQDRLVTLLQAAPAPTSAPDKGDRCALQLVFCIDVRSERFRRALEGLGTDIETRGFAGFFGLPIRYTPLGSGMPRHQLPGLLGPSLDITESTGNVAQDAEIEGRRTGSLATKQTWQAFQRTPSGAFAQVETLGIAYAGAILKQHLGIDSRRGRADDSNRLRLRLCLPDDTAPDRKTDLAESILRAMSLTAGFARLLVLVGHGSQTANNPQAASLDCGACGGHTGEVNARVLAGLLNDPAVRTALGSRGIHIPQDTVAIGALHNTTTDDVQLFDVDDLPATHLADLERLQRCLAKAAIATRAERAPDLGLADAVDRPEVLLQTLQRRARDWAETRPEWGLADNLAFIVAPRSRTRSCNLQGRSFLHDYSWQADPHGAVLELILTAPMVVAHWINLQYYASTVDPERYGSGNKLLHNVACGRVGLFEGNTGDLRIGLARQSVHDGTRWMHRPLRLSVFIDAPRDRIEGILSRQATVRQLVDNRWLYLFRYGEQGIEWRQDGEWTPWQSTVDAA